MTAANVSNPPAPRLQTFAAMSAVLTGFQGSVISPALDPVNLKTLYLQTADAKATPALVDQLLQQFTTLQGQGLPKQQIADTLLGTTANPPSDTALLARAIVKMWYLGMWFPNGSTVGTVISSQAYIGGLTWQAAQAHPMGYSTFTFGYWKDVPPPLSAFGVDLPDGGSND
jgi:hypothetical protein